MVLALWLAFAATDVLAVSVRATVDKPTLDVTETLMLSIVLEGVTSAGQPELPAIPNFDVVTRSASMSADSRGLAQQVFSYSLQPRQPGDFVIPAFQFKLGGEIKTTEPIRVKVVPAAVLPWFAKVILPKPQLYVGEVSETELRVYFLEGRMTQYPQFPTDPGFNVGKWSNPTQTRETISNRVYTVMVFKVPITPVKAGALTLGPATAALLVPDPSRAPGFFFGRPEREVRMTAGKVVVPVLPVPTENAPPSFAGAVGNFSLVVTAAPTNVAAGDPITVRVQVRGRGALDALQLPPQPDWTEFKTYPPTSRIEGADANNTSGTKTFEQAVIPERAGVKMLPAFAFSFFDPNQKTFRTLKGPAFALNVSAGAGGGAALPSLPGSTNAAPAQPASDLAHIKPFLGSVAPQTLLLTRPWFLGVQLVPPLVWLSFLVNRKRREKVARDPRLRRRAEVSHLVRRGLSELRAQASSNNSEMFFALGLRLLQEQIGERVDLPANAITEAVVEERMRPAGAPSELCAAVQELFQSCNLARYAPVKSSAELSALVPKFEHAIRELQRWEPARS